MSYRWVVALVPCCLALGACQTVKDALSGDKTVPDEFAVVSRAPLAIPPDFALRPPRVGEARPQETSPTDQARATVFRAGDDQKANIPPPTTSRSVGETDILKEAGVADSPSNIRQLITSEAQSDGQMSEGLVDRLAFWRSPPPKLGPTDSVINPSAEADRLAAQKLAQQNTAPKPADLAGTPTIERTGAESATQKSGGWFGWLF